jgi:hypothetical protein
MGINMKLTRVEIGFNDDGTMQIEARCECDTMMSYDKCKKTYSAKNWSEVESKIEEAKKEFSGMKGDKKGKPNKSVKNFMEVEEADED